MNAAEGPGFGDGEANASLCVDKFPEMGSQESCPFLRRSGIHWSRGDFCGRIRFNNYSPARGQPLRLGSARLIAGFKL